MPCSDGGPTEADLIKNRLDRLTRLVCSLLRRIEKESKRRLKEGAMFNAEQVLEFIYDDSDLTAWWSKHKKEDAIRIKKEKKAKELKAQRTEALKKLTRKERKLLGL